MKGELYQANVLVASACDSLREALSNCSGVESIVVLGLISRAVVLEQRITELLNAKEFDEKREVRT